MGYTTPSHDRRLGEIGRVVPIGVAGWWTMMVSLQLRERGEGEHLSSRVRVTLLSTGGQTLYVSCVLRCDTVKHVIIAGRLAHRSKVRCRGALQLDLNTLTDLYSG